MGLWKAWESEKKAGMESWIVTVFEGVMSRVGVPWRWDGSPECRLHIGDTAGPSSWDSEGTRHLNLRYARARQRVTFVPRAAI